MTNILPTFLAGLVFLLFSTHQLIKLAEKLVYVLKISPLIIGITIVALGTSLPELAVSSVSLLEHDTGLALGNIVGSNIVNILLVFPAGIFIGKLRIGTTKTQRNTLVLLGATALFLLAQFYQPIKPIAGVILIGSAILVSFLEYQLGVTGRKHEDAKSFKSQKRERFRLSLIYQGAIYIFGIILGSFLIVNSVEKISTLTGVSTTILGLTLTAIATSLPELMTTIFSQEDHQEKITLGNLIGSNIYNLLLIGGIISLIPQPGTTIQFIGWFWLVFTTIVFVYILRHYQGNKPPKFVGLILLLFFLVYLITQ